MPANQIKLLVRPQNCWPTTCKVALSHPRLSSLSRTWLTAPPATKHFEDLIVAIRFQNMSAVALDQSSLLEQQPTDA